MWVSIFCVRLVAADVVRERCMSIGRATTTTILYTATCATHNDCGTSTLNVRAVREQYRNERTFPPHYFWRCGVWRLDVGGVEPFSGRPRKCSPRWKNVICIFCKVQLWVNLCAWSFELLFSYRCGSFQTPLSFAGTDSGSGRHQVETHLTVQMFEDTCRLLFIWPTVDGPMKTWSKRHECSQASNSKNINCHEHSAERVQNS